MPIPKRIVDEYLNRQVRSFTWLKELTPLEVEEELSHLDPPHKFTIPFWIDQKICFLLGIAYPEVLFMTDLGLGKTGVSLELFTYFYRNGFIRRAFVFCPTNEVAEGWVDEIQKWGFTIPYLLLTDALSTKKWERFDKLNDGLDGLIIGTYAGISAMVSQLVPKLGKDGKPLLDKNGHPTGKRERVVVDRRLLRLVDGVDAVVYDQSTKLGNRNSLSFEVCNEFAIEAQIRFGLAGRAFGRDPFVLWSQFMLVDRGKALGRSPGLFREAFWRRQETPWGVKWIRRKRREKELARFVAASSIRYSVDEARQLPQEMPPIIKRCSFTDATWAYYDKFQEELLHAKGNYREIKNSFLRMRQIASGFLGFIDDDTGERAQIEFPDNPKLDLLMEIVDEIPEDRKLIIYHEFNWSGSRICQELARKKIKHGWLRGGTKDWSKIKDGLNNDPEFRILVANHRKGAMGLNLQMCNYTAFYESPVSAIDRYECKGRTRRTGQTQRCFYYDLVMRDSVDEDILAFHAEGNDLFKAIVENPQRIIKRRNRRA